MRTSNLFGGADRFNRRTRAGEEGWSGEGLLGGAGCAGRGPVERGLLVRRRGPSCGACAWTVSTTIRQDSKLDEKSSYASTLKVAARTGTRPSLHHGSPLTVGYPLFCLNQRHAAEIRDMRIGAGRHRSEVACGPFRVPSIANNQALIEELGRKTNR